MSTTTSTISGNPTLWQDPEHYLAIDQESNVGLRDLRKDAISHFLRMGIPNKHHEEWKYLNFASLAKTHYHPVTAHQPFQLTSADAERFRLAGKDAILVMIENGRLNKQASNLKALPKGIQIGTLADFADDAAVVSEYAMHAPYQEEPFVALNTALAFAPVVVKVDNHAIIPNAIQIICLSNADHEAIAVNVRFLIVVGKHAECTLVKSHHTIHDRFPVFLNTVVETVLGENAKLNFCKVQDEREKTTHINYHKVIQARDSVHHITTLTIGGSLVRNNLNILLNDENCNAHLNGLYVMNGTQVVDNHTLVDHSKPNCYSNELYKGIIDEKSTGVFNGKIFVREDAQKTNAFQSNKNIILSNDATMNTKPQLEIFADDVKCSHGATTGQIDEEALFYLRSRGIAEPEARALLNHAFAADVINQVALEPLRESLMELLNRKLRELEA
ncbi:Fe-S cluster assembly protein SufD [soil metagenome]